MSIGALRGLADDAEKGKLVIAAILGLLITGAAIFGSFYKVPSPTILAPWYAVIWLVVGIVAALLVKGRAPASGVLADLSSGGDA
jgi:hypothetical protein